MKRTQFFLIAGFALVAMLFSNSNAMADDWDQKTLFTINQPVSVPGHVVLPAGTYVIKRVNAMTPVVQVLNKSETKVYATVFPCPTMPQVHPTILYSRFKKCLKEVQSR